MNAQNLKDSTYEKSQSLNDVNITAKKISSFLKRQDATTKLDITFINTLPKILGNTDPIHYLQTMPGISTNNEYDAGIHIMGCSTGHNLVGINGIYDAIILGSQLYNLRCRIHSTHLLLN